MTALQTSPTETLSAAKRMYGLDALRVFGSIFVLYQHFSGWMSTYHYPWEVQDAVEAGLIQPLRLDAHTGYVGVCVFFVISGVVVTHATYRESIPEFLGRRAARILPALWVAVLLGWALVNIGLVTTETGEATAPASALVNNMTLMNYVFSTPNVLPVAWTLAIEIPFYLISAALIPVFRRWAWAVPAIEAAGLSILLSVVNTEHTAPSHLLRLILTLLPTLFLGQLISLVVSKRLHAAAGAAYGVIFVMLFIRAGLTSDITPDGDAYARVLVLVVLVAILATRATGGFASSRVISVLASRTYSLYLVHLGVSFSAMGLLYPRVGKWPSLVLSLLAVAIFTELLYRLVEKPATEWFRRRSRARG